MGVEGFQRRTLFGTPKRKAPRSNRGGCARKCHVPESMWHFFRFEQVAVCGLKLQEYDQYNNLATFKEQVGTGCTVYTTSFK